MSKNTIIYTDERHVKLREYSREYVKRKKLIKEIGDGKKPLRNVPISLIPSVQPTQLNFKGSDRDEPRCCLHFGCGRHLSITEILAGNCCINHQHKQKIDVAKHISHPIKQIA